MIAIIRRRAPCSIQSIRSNTIQSRLKRKHGYSSIQEKSTKQTLQAAFTTKLSIFNSIGNPSFESQYEIATKRHFSSISNRIWEMVQSGSMDPSNPIIDDIVSQKDGNTLNDRLFRFSNYQPHHFFDAAEELQEKYESALTQLESEIVLSSQSKEEKNYNVQLFESCREVLRTLEEMSLPMIMFQNIVVINASLKNNNNDDAMINALSDASNIIQFKHESSKVIYDALLPFENVVCDSDKRETSRAILRLLQKLRTNGAMINDEETLSILKELNERILTSESKLVTLSSYTMEQHGKVTPTQKLLPFLYEIIALKQHRSKLLGYDNYASYSLDAHSCMVKDMDQLEQFHESFVEAGAVDKFANDDFMSQHYDIMNDDSLNPEFLEDYFELNRVLEKLFNLCSKLFGIVIEEEQDKSKVLAWDNDVRLFHVYENDTGNDDDGRRHIASFYIDAFNRLSKPVGEFMAPIVYKSNATPISSVAVSLSIRPPIWDESPTKMHVYDVVHLFHEFGHVLQNLLSTVELGAFSGAQVIEEDASEFVSQFMEYWLFQTPLLADISQHYETSEPLPNDIIEKLRIQHKSIKRNELLHRLFLGELEREVTTVFDPNGDESIIGLQRRCAEIFCPSHLPPKGNIDPLIQLFGSNAKGKCSVQYRYLWSEVMSADAFEMMSNKNESELKALGLKFRKCFLEPGGSVATETAFFSFRGREANHDALLEFYGLK